MKLCSRTSSVLRRGVLGWLPVGIAVAGLNLVAPPSADAQWWAGWWRPAAEPDKNVFETLESKSQYSTLVTAIEVAGLEDAVASLEDITVFAPTNRAFSKVPAATLEALLADPDALSEVLLYHVLGVRAAAEDVTTGSVETLLAGTSVDLEVKEYWGGRFRTITDVAGHFRTVPRLSGIVPARYRYRTR